MGLQKAVREKFGIKPRIRTGASGDLTVLVNGANIFNYKKEGSMPAPDEVLRRIAACQHTG